MIELRGGGRDVIITDQLESRVASFRGYTLQWEWRPQQSRCWRLPSEARLRHVDHFGGLVLLVADSLGYVGVVDSDGNEIWATDVGRRANPHAVEMLPGGLVAVAASDGGWVRIYSTTSQEVCAEMPLPGAHGLYWVPSAGLWALGTDELVLARVAQGCLTPSHRVPLPSHGGHDLGRVAGTPGRLWVSTKSHVYQYEPRVDLWHVAEDGIDRSDVKSVGDHPLTGQVLLTCADEQWWTDTLRMFNPDRTIRLPDARIYKARWSATGSSQSRV